MEARTKADRAREDYWVLRREMANEQLLLVREHRAQQRSKRFKERSGLPGPWFDFTVITLTLILGISWLIQSLL